MSPHEILDQIKKSNFKSAYEWAIQDPNLFLTFTRLNESERKFVCTHLSAQFNLKPQSHSSIGYLFKEVTESQWLKIFEALEIKNTHTEHKWALSQYRASHGELPFLWGVSQSKLGIDPDLSDQEICEFILRKSGSISKNITLLFSAKMDIKRKWAILEQLTNFDSTPAATKRAKVAVSKIKATFEQHQKVSALEIRRVLDSLLDEGKKDIESYVSRYLPILVQDKKEIALLYIRIKKGGLKPKKDKSNRPTLFEEIYAGRELFKEMVSFFEIEYDELNEFPFLEKVLTLFHLMQELYGQPNWPQLDEVLKQ